MPGGHVTRGVGPREVAWGHVAQGVGPRDNAEVTCPQEHIHLMSPGSRGPGSGSA